MVDLTSVLPEHLFPYITSGGWVGFGGNCYQLQNRGITTWPEAEEVCRSLGGHLTSIHSKAEEDFLVDLAQQVGQIWLGASDDATEVNGANFC